MADYYDYAGGGDVEAALIGFGVVADFGVFGEADVAVDDGAADARVAADIDVVIDDGSGDFAIAVDADVVAEEGVLDAAAGKNGAVGNDRIERDAHAIGIGENKFRWRILMLPGAQRPGLVVEVEDRRDADEIHVGFVIGVDGTDVAPVERLLGVFVNEVIGDACR